MIITIDQVLNPQELADIQTQLRQATEWVDGKLTAGWHAKAVKQNTQLAKSGAIASGIIETVRGALLHHPLIQAAALPKLIHSMLISRYTEGMEYGRHVDNALMGGTFQRADVSFTVFLSAPAEYEGGDLVIEGACDEQCYKLAAGSMLLYPAATLHAVTPIRSGTRYVVVGWIQSLVRDPLQREILFDLDTVRRSLFAQTGKTNEFDLLSKTYSNLLRRWAE